VVPLAIVFFAIGILQAVSFQLAARRSWPPAC
jgi:hypothetical protein